MLNQSHHRPREATVTRSAGSTRAHQHPEKPDVRPTSPVLREGPLRKRGSLLGKTVGAQAPQGPSTYEVGAAAERERFEPFERRWR